LEDLQKIENIGPKAAKSIFDYFQEKRNLEFFGKLEKAGVVVKAQKKEKQSLKGLSFVLTGSLETLARSQAKERIRKLGGGVSDTVSKNTNFLIVGLNPSSKLKKAKDLGVKVISEAEFLNILK